MAVLSREELLNTIKKYTENAEGDEVLTDVENIVETINTFDDVDERIREVDEKWHKKFIDKFFSSNTEVNTEEEKEEKDEEKEEDEEIFIEIEKED